MEFDLIISGGTVVDGTGAAASRTDVGVRDGRIAALGDLAAAAAREVVDATGLAVTPGFIDAHAHSDLAPLLAPEHADLVLGSAAARSHHGGVRELRKSPFPRTDPFGPALDRLVSNGFAVGQGAATGVAAYADLLGSLADTRAGALGGASGTGLATNLAPLLGHGTLRGAAMGFDDRAATDDELALMSRLATEAFEQGAFGFSTGLIYPPGVYAATAEIAELARVAARFGAPYVTHMRDEADHVDVSIREALTIGEQSGAGVQISHHKVAGRTNWGRSSETLAMLDRARAAGVDVSIDVYPYTAGSTLLHAVLPPWANDGGLDTMLGRIADGATRDRIARDLATGLPGWQNMAGPAGWENVVIAGSPAHPEADGRSIAELSTDSGRPPIEVITDLITADRGRTLIILHMMGADDVAAIRAWSGAMVGSDGIPAPGKPHPRIAGTFVRGLRPPDPANPWSGLPERVRRMTSMPAERFRIPERGRVVEGGAADLVVLDPRTVGDRASYSDPLLPPTGIRDVFVGGRAGIRGGRPTGDYAGRVLRAR